MKEEHKQYIREHYNEMLDREMADILGINPRTLSDWRQKNGLKKSKEFRSKYARDQWYKIDHTNFLAHSYKKGHIPVNKGKKPKEYMNEESYAIFKAHTFPKGYQPVNAMPVGTITWRKMGKHYAYFIKIRKGHKSDNYIKYCRYLYEKKYGAIPNGYAVTYIDGNPRNCVIENLALISRAELMKQNANYDCPEELKEIIELNRKINQKINELWKSKQV